MKLLHSEVTAGPEDTIVVSLDGQANVLLLDDCSFANYRCGRSFNYRGGWAKTSPVRLTPPYHGRWHVVVDLGGRAGQVRAGVRVVSQRQLV